MACCSPVDRLRWLQCEFNQSLQHRLKTRDGQAPSLKDITELADAYHRTLRTLAGHVPVFTYDSGGETSRPTG